MSTKFAIFQKPLPGDIPQAPPKNMWEAAEQGNTNYIINIVERTIEADVDQRDALQRTPLHWAAEMGHIEAAKALIDFGAEIDATECNGRTPVHLAARSANANMISTLLDNQTPAFKEKMANKTDNFGITPLFLTIQKGEEGRPAFELLMSFGGRYSEMATMAKASPTGTGTGGGPIPPTAA